MNPEKPEKSDYYICLMDIGKGMVMPMECFYDAQKMVWDRPNVINWANYRDIFPNYSCHPKQIIHSQKQIGGVMSINVFKGIASSITTEMALKIDAFLEGIDHVFGFDIELKYYSFEWGNKIKFSNRLNGNKVAIDFLSNGNVNAYFDMPIVALDNIQEYDVIYNELKLL